MKMSDYLRVRSALKSLMASTCLEVAIPGDGNGGFQYLFCKLNSPYMSHKSVDISHRFGVGTLLRNHKYELVISEQKIENAVRILYPSKEIVAVFERAIGVEVPQYIRENNMVWVNIADNFRGFDAKGKPIIKRMAYNGLKFVETFKQPDNTDERAILNY